VRFEGKIAVVTGAGSGIGLATAVLFAQEGATVIVSDVDEARCAVGVEAVRTVGGEVMAAPGDVSDRAVVCENVDRILAQYGRIDVLVNNAGIATSAPAEDYPLWDRIIAVNLNGPYYWAAEVAVRSMIERRTGAIVNVASTCGVVAIPNDSGYVAAKHGVVGLTKALAIEWAKYGIRVNCVCPGFTETPILIELEAKQPGRNDARRRRIPIGRGGTPEEQGRAILFFASDDSAYCTGTILLNDGGQTSLMSGWKPANEAEAV
jgi:NAD(P)-dependent dehydrogenase (short-subunit alcohol dehydrogenase family)